MYRGARVATSGDIEVGGAGGRDGTGRPSTGSSCRGQPPRWPPSLPRGAPRGQAYTSIPLGSSGALAQHLYCTPENRVVAAPIPGVPDWHPIGSPFHGRLDPGCSRFVCLRSYCCGVYLSHDIILVPAVMLPCRYLSLAGKGGPDSFLTAVALLFFSCYPCSCILAVLQVLVPGREGWARLCSYLRWCLL